MSTLLARVPVSLRLALGSIPSCSSILRSLLMAVVALTLAAVSGGCALHPATPAPPPQHIAVLELPPTVADRALRRVLHGRHEEASATALAADRRRIDDALATALREALPCADTSPLRPPGIIAGEDRSAGRIGQPLAPATLAKLQAAHPVDAYLRLSVTDYGETPRRWLGAYVAFEVVTTLGIAAALYAHKVTRAVAGAYLIEESVEEFSEGYAGFWALNRLSRPVRIEADLIDGHNGKVLRGEVHVGLARWRWRHLWHMDDPTRDALLDTSLRKAVARFVGLCRPGTVTPQL